MNAWKRQGLRLTGRLADIEGATERAVKAVALGDQFYGSALYVEDKRHPAEMAVIHQTSHDTSADHQEFVAKNLTRRRIPKATTSVGQALEEGRSGLYASQMAAHDCVNIVSENGSGRFVFQMAFAKGAAPEIAEPQKLIRLEGLQLNVFETVRHLMADYRDDLAEKMDLSPPLEPNGVLLYTDISGYKKIIEAEGEGVAYSVSDRLRDSIIRIAGKYSGQVIREEGDGIWTGFSQFDDRAMQAAREIHASYDAIRGRDVSKTVQGSRIRTALATGYMETALSGEAFDPFIKYNSLAFISARMMSDAAPRDRDFIALSPQASDYLAGFDPSALITHDVPSTFNPSMLEVA